MPKVVRGVVGVEAAQGEGVVITQLVADAGFVLEGGQLLIDVPDADADHLLVHIGDGLTIRDLGRGAGRRGSKGGGDRRIGVS